MEFSKFDIDDSYFTTLSKCSAHGELVSEETRLLLLRVFNGANSASKS